MQRQLKIKVRGAPHDEEEWLARFVRTLEVGRKRARRWKLRSLDDREGRFGWEASTDLSDRSERLTLSQAVDGDRAAEWTLTVESGPPEKAPPTFRGGEWLLGVLLGAAAFLGVRSRFGALPGVAAGLALLVVCGLILPRLAWRNAKVTPGDDPDEVDEELLDRVRRGAEAFAGFEVLTPEWKEPDLT